MLKERIYFYDLLRGIAIIFVVAIHSFSGLDTVEPNSMTFHLAILWRQLIGCAVPIFLFISGYFLADKDIGTKTKYFTFLKKQIPKVYVPMLLWSIPYFLLDFYNDQNVVLAILKVALGGYSVYYFVILILQYYLLLPYLQKLGSSNKGLIISAGISTISIIVLTVIKELLKMDIPLVIYAGPFPVWLIFFVVGIFIRHNSHLLPKSNKLFIYMLIGYTLSVGETYLHIYNSDEYSGLGIKLGAFIYSFFAVLFIFSYHNRYKQHGRISKIVLTFGNFSFGIYLIHMYFLSFISVLLINYMNSGFYFVDQFFLIIITLILSALFILITRNLNKPLFIKYFGF